MPTILRRTSLLAVLGVCVAASVHAGSHPKICGGRPLSEPTADCRNCTRLERIEEKTTKDGVWTVFVAGSGDGAVQESCGEMQVRGRHKQAMERAVAGFGDATWTVSVVEDGWCIEKD